MALPGTRESDGCERIGSMENGGKMDICCARLVGCVLSLAESPKPRDSPAREGLAPFYQGNGGLESLSVSVYRSVCWIPQPQRMYRAALCPVGSSPCRGRENFRERRLPTFASGCCHHCRQPPGPPGSACLSLKFRIPGSWLVETSNCVRICKPV